MNACPDTPSFRRAFSLVELLAVITIIGILSALVFAALSYVRDMANNTQCANNLRELGKMASIQALDNGGWVPQAIWFEDRRAARPNLLDYGLTDELMQCPATDLPKSYGININLVNGSINDDGQWGKNDVQYWVHGRYKVAELLDPSRAILFADTFSTTTGYYVVNDRHADYRHNGAAQVVYVDCHVGSIEPEDVVDNAVLSKGITKY